MSDLDSQRIDTLIANYRAEVKQLTEERDRAQDMTEEAQSIARESMRRFDEMHTMLKAEKAEVARLGALLREAASAVHQRCPTTDAPPWHSQCSPLCNSLGALLAGAPSDGGLNLPFVPWSKEREMVASWKGVDNDRRALAEKVREACAEVCDRLHQMVLSGAGEPQLGQRTAQAARMVRALNIDELLKESA